MTAQPPAGTHVTYQQQMKSCGKAGCTRCRPGTPGHGPYWYAYWHEHGRLRSRYLGKQRPNGDWAATQAEENAATHVAAPGPPGLRVRSLGDFALWRGEEPLPVAAWGPRMRTLFALLLESVDRPKRREELAEALAPDLAPGAAAHILRNALFRLRRALGSAAYLPSAGDRLRLEPAPGESQRNLWWDVQAFTSAAAAAMGEHDLAAGREARRHYHGDYLPGEELPATEARRAELQTRYQALLLHLARTAAAQTRTVEAEAYLRELLAMAPAQEQAGKMLMVLLARAGQRAAAVHVYQALAAALDHELGLAPDPQLRRLAAQLAADAQDTIAAAPPLREQTERGNVPHSATAFVGRQEERTTVAGALRAQRLVTLCGTGGIGKTRLAHEVGHEVLSSFDDGVWQVELARVPSSEEGGDGGVAHIAPALLQTLGNQQRPDQPLGEVLVSVLQARHLVLILDNCEHVRVPVAALVSSLLARCPRVHVLVTSRTPLELPDETVHQVLPLALPKAGDPQAVIAESEAVQLFVMRAHGVRADFRLDAQTVPAVVEICCRLDGIPLALELAATRVRTLQVKDIAARLDNRFRLLTGGNPVALPRHQTLRATLDWSYALLTQAEQRLLRRLGVFVDGWTLAAAEAVCGGSPLNTWEMMDLLAALVRHSLVLVETVGETGETRFRMLETVREYSLLRLDNEQERPASAAPHRQWCLALAVEAEARLRGEQQRAWLEQLEREHGNLQAALAWSCGDPGADPDEEGLSIATAIWQFWYMRSHLAEGRRWLARLFATFASAPTPLWAKAYNAAGCLAIQDTHLAQANDLLKKSLDTARAARDHRGETRALTNLAVAYHTEAAYEQAEAWYQECLDVFRRLGDRPNEATILQDLGGLALDRQDHPRARQMYEDALALWRDLGNDYQVSESLGALGELAWHRGDLDQSMHLVQESEERARQVANRRCLARNLITRARIATTHHDSTTATTVLRACLELQQQERDLPQLAEILLALAGLVALRLKDTADKGHGLTGADLRWAAELVGASESVRTASGGRPQGDQTAAETTAATLCEHVDPTAFAQAWRRGASLSPEQALALAYQGFLLADERTAASAS